MTCKTRLLTQASKGPSTPAGRAALAALKRLGGHDEFVASDVDLHHRAGVEGRPLRLDRVRRPGAVKVFTNNWPPLRKDAVYSADELERLADSADRVAHVSLVVVLMGG